MSILDEIRPQKKTNVYDLLKEAHFDVSDWVASQGRSSSPAANPKYSRDWVFIDQERVAMTIWHGSLSEQGGAVTYARNARNIARRPGATGQTRRRARDQDEALRRAYAQNLPITAILCAGKQRNLQDPRSEASKVYYRGLDSAPWHVHSYDDATGDAILVRGSGSRVPEFVDQFDPSIPEGGAGERIERTSTPFKRREDVRRYVLDRAKGQCEYCGADGFLTASGQVYLETHHVVPLSEGGPDIVSNVVALCPNHHREAHYGAECVEIRELLLQKVGN